jgi:hypothetical protein
VNSGVRHWLFRTPPLHTHTETILRRACAQMPRMPLRRRDTSLCFSLRSLTCSAARGYRRSLCAAPCAARAALALALRPLEMVFKTAPCSLAAATAITTVTFSQPCGLHCACFIHPARPSSGYLASMFYFRCSICWPAAEVLGGFVTCTHPSLHN